MIEFDKLIDYFKEIGRRKLYIIASSVFIFLLASWVSLSAVGRYELMKRKVEARKEDLKSIKGLEDEYLKKKAVLDAVIKKAYSLNASDSTVNIVEGMGSMVGIKSRINSLKPLEEKEEMGYKERGVEVKIEKIDLNQLLNFLYIIENNRGLLVIKEFSFKSRFEDPDLLDVTLKLVQVSRQA